MEGLHESGYVAGNNTLTPVSITRKTKCSCQSRTNAEKLHHGSDNIYHSVWHLNKNHTLNYPCTGNTKQQHDLWLPFNEGRVCCKHLQRTASMRA